MKVALALSLFANLLWLAGSSSTIFSSLPNIPASIATMLTGLGGLGMIAWQTNRGFKNLIRSQVHRSRIERNAREHQAKLDQRKRDAESRDAKFALAASIQAELTLILQNAELNSTSEPASLLVIKEFAKNNPVGKLNLNSFFAPVFSDAISKIGILGSSMSTDILRAYQIIEMNKTIEDGVFAALMEDIVEVRSKQFKFYIPFIKHAINRLNAYQNSHPDTGDFFHATVRAG